ncbi:YfiR family protein [Thauera mechernichensis]|uniref:YfiR family protein n=1 Tax=Thauera mechernichensis TaxID=82788 RepID=A0ABW3WB82_9RHOO|nr:MULTISPECIES: YfiR family protein [Thauera]ENO75196.1 hypothetical protein B447_20231 [Thauera sp. 27]ENO91145.1 hypothetical protein C662_17893 [Thauera sp. 28]MDG3065684.1 YfiR family protein [Thauera mechernichensis]WBL64767.1 YfiR family protein [Thauera sp. WB-2]HAG73998.1 DUF4154 domain-containing protein [Thauera sp.]
MRLRALACLLLVVSAVSGARGQAVPEHELKATYAYNFAALTQWPASARTSFNLCVLGDDELALAMRRLEGKVLHGRVVSAVPLAALSAIRDCDVLFVGAGEQANLSRIVDALGDAPVLTVSDAPSLQDVAIRIVPEGSRLAFEVDVERCRRAGLKPGAALLDLARKVRLPTD